MRTRRNGPGGDDGAEDGDHAGGGRELRRARSVHSPGCQANVGTAGAGWWRGERNRSQILVEQEALILFLMLTRTTACIHTEELHDVAVIENQSCATVEDKPVTIRVTQATGKNWAHADFLCLLLCAASYRLRNSFLTGVHFYYLNPSMRSPIQLSASSFSWNSFKKFSLT